MCLPNSKTAKKQSVMIAVSTGIGKSTLGAQWRGMLNSDFRFVRRGDTWTWAQRVV